MGRVVDRQPRIPEGGKIKIGWRGKARPTRDGGREWRPPIKLDHFVLTKAEREDGKPDADFVVNRELMTALVQRGYGDPDGKLRKLPVYVYSDDPEVVMSSAYVAYRGRSKICTGDGDVATRYEIDGQGRRTGKTKRVKCSKCDWREPNERGERRCKLNAILTCAIRLPGFTVIGSAYTLRTTSGITHDELAGSIGMVATEVGGLRGVPLLLIVRPKRVSPPGQAATTVYCCYLEAEEQLERAQLMAKEAKERRLQLADGREEMHVHVLPGTEEGQDAADVVDEFYPEQAAGGAIDTTAEPAGEPISEKDKAKLQQSSPSSAQQEPPPADEPPPGTPATKPPQRPTPPPADEPKQRTRRSRCKQCNQLCPPGTVKDGVGPCCRGDEQDPPPADGDTETGGAAIDRLAGTMNELMEISVAAIKRGVPAAEVRTALSEVLGADFDADGREYTQMDIALAKGALDGLQAKK